MDVNRNPFEVSEGEQLRLPSPYFILRYLIIPQMSDCAKKRVQLPSTGLGTNLVGVLLDGLSLVMLVDELSERYPVNDRFRVGTEPLNCFSSVSNDRINE
jgi:hypothetical protein